MNQDRRFSYFVGQRKDADTNDKSIILGLIRRNKPAEEDIVSQARILCTEFVTTRLNRASQLNAKQQYEASKFIPSDTLKEIEFLAGKLEKYYGQLFNDVSEQLGIPFTSESAVRETFRNVAENLFKERKSVTWAKVIALFCLSGSFACDCSRQNRSEFVPVIIDSFTEFVKDSLLDWIKRRGGWVSKKKKSL
ncbi:DgyrCDS13790 [Dimorphilus gyrociliatus]|uniref:DgyrCDS13790 n=1 Tax=Dimorphilus gyrociliatus TaxID=2664684 RepID=A0A7I8WBS8_9ANNE|nr:DgyrCDS13790 [Dimorphilus gyrociliatus]